MTRLRFALLSLALLAGLGAVTGRAQPGTGTGTAIAAPRRPGYQIQFATIGGASAGLTGRAFIPIMAADVTVQPSGHRGACAGLRVVEANGRSLRGYVRSLKIVLRTNATGDLPIGAHGCPGASLEATLENGHTLRDGDGTVTVDQWETTPAGQVHATFSWTPRHGREPLPFRGDVLIPLPR
ncbi:MAG: hypothetical protein U0230_08400 [Polyangiales bacterium]